MTSQRLADPGMDAHRDEVADERDPQAVEVERASALVVEVVALLALPVLDDPCEFRGDKAWSQVIFPQLATRAQTAIRRKV